MRISEVFNLSNKMNRVLRDINYEFDKDFENIPTQIRNHILEQNLVKTRRFIFKLKSLKELLLEFLNANYVDTTDPEYEKCQQLLKIIENGIKTLNKSVK